MEKVYMLRKTGRLGGLLVCRGIIIDGHVKKSNSPFTNNGRFSSCTSHVIESSQRVIPVADYAWLMIPLNSSEMYLAYFGMLRMDLGMVRGGSASVSST